MNAPAKVKEAPVLRPLKVLVSLIKDDLEKIKRVHVETEKAQRPLFLSIGEKLLEAKAQLPHGEFLPWVRDNLDLGYRAAQQYMAISRTILSSEKRDTIHFAEDLSFRQAVRDHTTNKNFGKPASWRADVAENVRKAKAQATRLDEETLSRSQERDAERALALRLIDIGYKVLAKELHPDRGGTKDAMSRLGKVRARLKGCA